MSTLLSLLLTILISSHLAAASSCYYDSFGYRRCSALSNGARIGIGIGFFVLGIFLIFLILFQRRRRMANRNTILLQHQQQQQPAQWGALGGAAPYNAGTPYGQPYGQQQPYAQPAGYQYPNNTGYPNNQQQPYQPGYTGAYTAATPAVYAKGYDVSTDNSANVQPPERTYDPSQSHAAPSANGNPHANNPVEPPYSQPPGYSGYQAPTRLPPQMPTPTGGSQNPEGHGSNNPYVYNPPTQTKS